MPSMRSAATLSGLALLSILLSACDPDSSVEPSEPAGRNFTHRLVIQSVDTARQYIGVIAVDTTDRRFDSNGFYVGDSIYWDTLEAGEVSDTVVLQSHVYYRYYVGTWQRHLDGIYYGGVTNGPIRCDDRDPSLYVVQAAEGRLLENELPLR